MTSINPSLKLDYCQLFSTAKSQSIRFDQMDYLNLSHRMASTIPIEVLSTSTQEIKKAKKVRLLPRIGPAWATPPTRPKKRAAKK